MDTTLLPRSSWKNGELAKQFGNDLREWEGAVWSFLVRKLKSLGLIVDGIPGRFCSSLSTACSPPSQIETVAPLVSVNGVHNCSAWLRGFLVCKQLSKPWLLFYLRFPGLLFRRRRTLTTPYHNPATKQCPVHVCQMYLPLSLSWSIFQWLLSLSWLRWIQPRQRFCPEQSEFTVILGAFYRLQEEMIKHTKVESMLDRSQIFTTAAKSKLQIGIRGIIWKNACRKSKQHFILMACWTTE